MLWWRMPPTSRRDLLKYGLGASATLALPGCATGPVRKSPNAAYLALAPHAADGCGSLALSARKDWDRVLAQAVSAVTDLRWLGRGDSVFVKVVSNSGNQHPAVTAPQAVSALVSLLRAAGAGRVLVGDQSGAEHVRRWKDGRRSSTRERFAHNGLLAAIERSGAELHCFDDQPWESNFQAEPDFESAWDTRLYLPRILHEVDHVVLLPRLGAHALAGYSGAVKAAVGYLRDDSRLALHREGDRFYERIAEINHVRPLRDKLRLIATVVDKALVSVGPDIGETYGFEGCFALASTSLFDHDAIASSLLPYLAARSGLSVFDFYAPYPSHVNYWNRWFLSEAWGDRGVLGYQALTPPQLGPRIADDAVLSHLAVLTGRRPGRIEVRRASALPDALVEHLRGARDGLLRV
jgi:uncharacterized protein (DUF362 family)